MSIRGNSKVRKPPKRLSNYKKAVKLELGLEQARIKARFKMEAKKPLIVSAREHIGKVIDNMHINPIEALAVVSGTIVIHGIIVSAPTLYAKAVQYGMTVFAPLVGGATNPFLFIFQTLWEKIVIPLTATSTEPVGSEGDIGAWLTSFFLSYTICKYGGDIIGLGTNLSVLIGMLLA